ncbi:organic cation transporter protein isoform X3 [Halyomorpha halys]|uniref:organic cation transporter protein isoform X3 n=1 Tax=Halyomorpha halys TaxID=286706 RepID=UPI000D0C806E|nr:organic cation transporter-like protein isoform X3 [Halyomorpha halys]
MDPAAIENALEKKCKNHCWLVWILFLTASPTIVVGSHLVSYVFLGGNPSFFCNIPELVEANWTKEQIREISSPGLAKQSCVHYAWNYSILKDLDFNDALSYCNTSQKPDLVKCKNYIYDEEVVHQTIVSKWDLVCDDLPLRSTAQSSVAVGKVIGAVLLGMLSDRYGRKKVFIFSSILFWVAGPSAAFVDSYIMFIAFRLMIGIAGSGLYETAYTILLELTVKTYRAYLANIFNLAFSCGLLQLSILAYLTNDWRQLQLAISIPMVLLVIHCWFLPESPRWLITSGKLEKASKIIGSAWRLVPIDPDHTPQLVLKHQPGSSGKSLLFFLKDYLKLFSTFELTKRTLICNYLWFMGNLYYFVISWPIICVSLVGRLVLASAYGIIMFYTIELYPTENRNTAMGSCITTSQFGPMLAPYIVDILGKIVWWLPTALSGSLALLGAFLLTFLPETRNTPMLDTICEMKDLEREDLRNDVRRSS